MMSENQSRRVLGEHKVVESIQSIADWVTKAKKVMSDIKSNKVDYNFYEITSDLEEDIARTDSDMEKEVLTGLLHSLNNAYSKIADKDDKEDIREDKELLIEDLDEAFYEKICRAYIDTMNLEWVTTNPENNDSVVHGYFADDETASKWEYGAKVTPENFKDIAYEGYTEEEIENGKVDWYEYETWEDFYEDIVKSNIDYDINDIGVYSFDGNWDFYISEEDLTKLGLWNEDMKSEFLDESKKVTEAEQYYDLYITYADNSTGYARVSARGAGDIVSTDISKIKRIDIEDGGMNHDLDENKDEDKILTWDEIFKNAEGTTFGQKALKVKDQARAEVEELMQKDGIDVDGLENVEDEIEEYVTKHNIKFASNGCIIK